MIEFARTSPLGSSTTKHAFTVGESDFAELMEQISGVFSLRFAAINTVRFPDPRLKDWKCCSEDLFAMAPEEIRQENSLYLYEFGTQAKDRQIIVDGVNKDALTVLLTNDGVDTVIESQKLVWAWFSKPSILRHQLENGSKHLAEQLLAAVRAAAIFHESSVNVYSIGSDTEALVAKFSDK
ncbi:MAG: hypothetical protein SGI77_21435 [Pirellulaceae bacterium]|nr:hypothetical protein [Pirellulaceae bacterium]